MFLDANKREEILPQERMVGFLDSLVAHGEKTVDPCNSSIRRKGVCHRSQGGNKFVRCILGEQISENL